MQEPKWMWSHDQTFEISGKTLELFLHLKNSILSHPESQNIIMAAQLNELLGKVVEEGIKSGKITDGENKIPTDLNHYSSSFNQAKSLKLITGLDYLLSDGEKTKEVEYTITKVSEPVWFGDYWISQEELDIWKALEEEGATAATWGYIHGTMHHLGDHSSGGMLSASMNPGYIMWIKYK